MILILAISLVSSADASRMLRVSSTAQPSTAADGSAMAPFHSVQAALEYNRLQIPKIQGTTISLSSGLHTGFRLVPKLDDGIKITGSVDGPPSVVTGGVEVPPNLFVANRSLSSSSSTDTTGIWTLRIVSDHGCASYGCPTVTVVGSSIDKFRVTVRKLDARAPEFVSGCCIHQSHRHICCKPFTNKQQLLSPFPSFFFFWGGVRLWQRGQRKIQTKAFAKNTRLQPRRCCNGAVMVATPGPSPLLATLRIRQVLQAHWYVT